MSEQVLGAAQSGDVRRALEALRDGLAAAFDAADVNLRPQISGQLRAVLADLAAMPPTAKVVTATDEIRARREANGKSTSVGDAPSRRQGQQRRQGRR